MDALYALPVDPEVPPPPASVTNQLELAGLDVGVHRMFVELVGDGLATGIRVPVVVARGAESGPVFGITACVHGNELNGIAVIHRLMQQIDVRALRGTVVGVVAVNVPGLHRYERTFVDGTDLNRIMPGRADGTVGQVYAYRLIDRIINRFDMLLDLHTASFGRINSLYVRADMSDASTAKMAYLQRPQIIVHNPAADQTLRGTAMALGIPAITVEIGDPQRWQERLTRSTLAGVRDVMHWAGHIDDVTEHSEDGLNRDPDEPEAEPPVICRSSSWMYTDRGGLLRVYGRLAERVGAGQRIATVTNAFGDAIREYDCPRDGIIVGKSTNPVGQTGARIVHLGDIARGDDAFLLHDSL